jgi:outer membrane protein insertion porin family
LVALHLLVIALQFGFAEPSEPTSSTSPRSSRRVAEDPYEGRVVVAVEISGNRRLTKDQVLPTLRTKLGQPYRAADVDADVKAVFSRFGARAEVRVARREEGVTVEFALAESRAVDAVEIVGVDAPRGRELLDMAGLRDVRPLFENQVEQRARDLRNRLLEDGRFFATVAVAFEERPGATGETKLVAVLTVVDGAEVAIDDIVFDGLGDAVDPDVLRDLMTTDTATLGIFDEYLRQDALDRDIVEIERFLRREGWRDATARVASLDFDESNETVVVRIGCELGPRYTIGEVSVVGAAAEHESALRELLEIAPGAPIRLPVIARDEASLTEYYGSRGHVRARIAARIVFREEGTVADVSFEIVEGVEKRVRDVRILGNAATLDEVIRRRLTIEPGDLASSTELARSADRLRALRYFDDAEGHSRVDVRFEPTADPLLEDVFVDVEEAHAGRLFFSVFASTDLGLFGGIQLELDNFDITDTPSAWDPVTLFSEIIDQRAFHGAGQSLDIALLPGTHVSTYRITFVEPYLFGPEQHPRSLRVDLYSSASRLEDEFEEVRTGLALTYGKEWDDHWTSGVTGRLEFVDVDDVDDAPDDVDDVEGTNVVPALGVFARYVDYDSLRDPQKGFEFGVRYDLLFADGSGNRLVLDEKSKIPLLRDDRGRYHTLNIRSALGLASGFSGDLPFFERFQGGGAIGDFPVRGFEYRGIGPESKDVHLGGHFAYGAAFEYEFPLYATYDPVFDENVEYLRAVTFLDLASVENGFGDVFGRTRAAVGAGLRIKLPFLGPTPLAIDLGFPIVERADDETEVLSIRFSKRF